MNQDKLTHKPLVEAIFELHWKSPSSQPGITGMQIDPHYDLLVGRIFDRVCRDYPFYEQLPTSTIPDELAGHIVQHRYRTAENQWPLVQLGPGVITLNDTAEAYGWNEFIERIAKVKEALIESHPDSKSLSVETCQLRYIDAIDFDYQRDNIFEFLKQKMRVSIELPQELFKDSVSELPLNFDLSFTFPSLQPKGATRLRLARGARKRQSVLIMETMVVSSGDDAPSIERSDVWAIEAHEVTHAWFFDMVQGDLLEGFR